MIPNEIISNKNISHGAFKLYCILNSYCYGNKDTCFPSQKTLAEHMKKCTRTIQRYLKELLDNGIIKIMRRGSTSNLYQLLSNAVKKAKQCTNDLFGMNSNKNKKYSKKECVEEHSSELDEFRKKYQDDFFTESELEYFMKLEKQKKL
jgi:DNA-binding transcriptional regulator YhcF (GntR family)